MNTPLTLVTTSSQLVTSLLTSFSTIYQTSKPPLLTTTITSIASQLNTILQTATITQQDTVMESTIAFPVTITQTLSQLVTTTRNISPPATRTILVTSTLTSTLIQPEPTITYYPPLIPPAATTTMTQIMMYPVVYTATLTQLELILENAAGQAYTTFTTNLPGTPSDVNGVVVITEYEEHGWDSWSSSEQGGLIAGVVIAGILLLGLVLWCLARRRRIWLASEWVGPPQQQVVTTRPANYAHWGPGPAGWGIRGGNAEEKGWWRR